METKVNGLLIKDSFGVQRRVSSRCANGNFKRKYIRGLIRQGVLQPTNGVVTLLGEVLDENERLRRELFAAREEVEEASTVIWGIEQMAMSYFEDLCDDSRH